ncbi:MAG: lysophospholipase [Candidatus Desulforudis sp.]|nr:lysophospholipase [Desulforudis sp.]MBV1735123.1 lysophospholipase [Desulforudis sp.]
MKKLEQLKKQLLAEVTDNHGFLEVKDGKRLFYRYWLPDGNPKCVILFVHGLSLHSGSAPYGANIAEPVLRDYGAAVYAFDMRGHGFSNGVGGDYPKIDLVMDDLARQVEFIKSQHRKVPVFLYGHDVGGLQVMNYAGNYGTSLSGSIVTGYAPTVRMDHYQMGKPGFGEQLKMAFTPLFKRGATISRVLTLDHYERRGGKDPETIKMLKVVADDPLAVTAYSIRFYFGSGVRKEFENARKIKKPFLMILGDRDQMFEPDPARQVLDEVASNIKRLRVLENVDHYSVITEAQKTIVQWLEKLEMAGLAK